MSVINQMLKDLEERDSAPNSTTNPAQQVPAAIARRGFNGWLTLLIIIITCLTAAVVYLLIDNKEGKHSPQTQRSSDTIEITKQVTREDKLSTNTATVEPSPLDIQTDNSNQAPDVVSTKDNVQTKIATENATKPLPVTEIEPELTAQKLTKDSTSPMRTISAEPQAEVIETEPKKQQEKANEPRLSITSSVVDEKSLIEKKRLDAQIAMTAGDLDKAQQQFEDILVLSPAAHDIREQLAAIWFGQSRMTQAGDLLLQGLNVYPEQWSFRLMLAKIYSATQRNSEALNVLTGMPLVDDAEYQALLANLAQQLKQHQLAIASFAFLTKRYPEQSRWWLGLAISQDSLAQFDSAKTAYRQAMNKADVTQGSLRFIQQRLVQLGD